MIYDFEGHFIEACDCFELCPCWVDDEPDEGHCTGLVAWAIDRGEIDGENVENRRVVAVTTHSGRRRSDGASTVLFVDDAADDAQLAVLTRAFSAADAGGLADLVGVTGPLVGEVTRATIAITSGAGAWSVRVGPERSAAVRARGRGLTFDDNRDPLTLNRTALHKELSIAGEATAQRSAELKLVVPALGGSGYQDVTERSGMCGAFRYRYL